MISKLVSERAHRVGAHSLSRKKFKNVEINVENIENSLKKVQTFTTMSSLKEILDAIDASLTSFNDAVSNLHEKVETPDLPDLVQDLLIKTNQSMPEGVSLLDLKNNAMLSYINNLVLIILGRIENLKTNDTKQNDVLKDKAIKDSIVQRVVLERGIKNLEKKLSYQLEKMVRNYNKMDKESNEDAVNKKLEKQEGNEEENLDEDSEEEEDSEDELNYRPDASSLVKDMKKQSGKESRGSRGSKGSENTEKYRPPKIAAALPPSEFNESRNASKSKRNGTKLQAMEEYLLENGDAPMVEQSIGSNILQNGRGGVQTMRDRKKEEEIKRFEESNFTRLSTNMSKKDKAKKKRQDTETFLGEDWGIFNNKREDMNTKRSIKPKSAWERAKKRRTD